MQSRRPSVWGMEKKCIQRILQIVMITAASGEVGLLPLILALNQEKEVWISPSSCEIVLIFRNRIKIKNLNKKMHWKALHYLSEWVSWFWVQEVCYLENCNGRVEDVGFFLLVVCWNLHKFFVQSSLFMQKVLEWPKQHFLFSF